MGGAVTSLPVAQAVYTLPDSSCAGTKNMSDRAFVLTQNADFGSIFVPEGCCAASVLKVYCYISADRFL